jgi:hypothetical protein
MNDIVALHQSILKSQYARHRDLKNAQESAKYQQQFSATVIGQESDYVYVQLNGSGIAKCRSLTNGSLSAGDIVSAYFAPSEAIGYVDAMVSG